MSFSQLIFVQFQPLELKLQKILSLWHVKRVRETPKKWLQPIRSIVLLLCFNIFSTFFQRAFLRYTTYLYIVHFHFNEQHFTTLKWHICRFVKVSNGLLFSTAALIFTPYSFSCLLLKVTVWTAWINTNTNEAMITS